MIPLYYYYMESISLGSMTYLPGSGIKKTEPLGRYLPPIPDGVISSWLLKNVRPGDWILDPFCASPRLAVEAARAGYRLLVTANNPIARFLLEMAAIPPTPDDLISSLAELSASYKADDRMEPHIRSLYDTLCSRCGQAVSAEAFLWEEDSQAPYARIYTCPNCGDSGEHPTTQHDVEKSSQFTLSGLHKARALERVVAATDQDRIHVEQALSVYIPRALYALITIINKMEGLDISPLEHKYLSALLLHAFDQANAMWRPSSTRERRRQLAIPRQFRENNIWLALEQGIHIWSSDSTADFPPTVPITIWPEQPPETGGICVYEGRLISIADSLSGLNIKSVCAAIPRPNQAYWTLSALWAGWLWGREAVGSFKSVLHRQRYDWGWHTTALASVFKQLVNILGPTTPILGLIGETEPGFIASALVAARYTGCSMKGIAIRAEEEQAQIEWINAIQDKPPLSSSSLIEVGAISARTYLENRSEPASYLNTITAAFINIIQAWSTPIDSTSIEKIDSMGTQPSKSDSSSPSEPTPSIAYSHIYNSAREALSYRSGFLRFNIQDLSNVEPVIKTQIIQETLFSLDLVKIQAEAEDLSASNPTKAETEQAQEKERPTRSSDITESILMWLRDTVNTGRTSISDKYELAVFDYLSTRPTCTSSEVNLAMCEIFPGLYTPDSEFIRICLDSYTEKYLLSENLLQLRTEDSPEQRRADLERAFQDIQQISNRLSIQSFEHQSDGISSLAWKDDDGELDFCFFPTTSANIGRIVLFNDISPGKGFIVLPASRANIVIYKLRRDPRLNKAFNPSQGNWRFLKFRHLRSLVDNPTLTRENLDQLLKLDPLTYTFPQLRMI